MQTQGGSNNRQIIIIPAGQVPDYSTSYTKNPQTPQSYPQAYPQSYPPVYPQVYQQQNYPPTYDQF